MNFQVRLINLALGFLYNVNGNSCSVSLRVRKSDMAKNGNAEPKTKSGSPGLDMLNCSTMT